MAVWVVRGQLIQAPGFDALPSWNDGVPAPVVSAKLFTPTRLPRFRIPASKISRNSYINTDIFNWLQISLALAFS